MEVKTLTIIHVQEEKKPPNIFFVGTLPLQLAIQMLQNFIIEAAKEEGRKEAATPKKQKRTQ